MDRINFRLKIKPKVKNLMDCTGGAMLRSNMPLENALKKVYGLSKEPNKDQNNSGLRREPIKTLSPKETKIA